MDTQTAILLAIAATAAIETLIVTVHASAQGRNAGAWFLLSLAWCVGVFPAVCLSWGTSFTVAVILAVFSREGPGPGTSNAAAYAIMGALALVLFVPLLALAATNPARDARRVTRSTSRTARI